MPALSGPSAAYDRLKLTAYSRDAVRETAVAVIGCGALGSEAARLLGLLGLGSVLLIDRDAVEATNLTHSPYFRSPSALGRPKTEVLAENLAAHFPDTSWSPLSCEIADAGFQRLQKCALLFSCTDNLLARVETSYAAFRLGLPMMDAGLKGHAYWSGRVAWLPGGSAACYLCQLGEVKRAELLSFSFAASQSCFADLPGDLILPSTPTMASIVAGLQVDLGLRLAMAANTVDACAWELSLPLPETGWSPFIIPRSADCPWHEFDPSLELAALSMDAPLNESLSKASGAEAFGGSGSQPPVLELDWPVCLRARCAACRHLWNPMVRVAVLRRGGICPVCGSSRLHPVQTLSRVACGDPFAAFTPSQLGLPSGHLFTLRRASPGSATSHS
jgi:molybdopterin/thiamine biosynthesis adenylyltransferase